MKTWIIQYETLWGDITSVWIEANTKEAAIDSVYDEYWDIYRVVSINISK